MRSKSKGGLKRKEEKYPGLKNDLHPRTRWEYMDQDYIKTLTDEEKKFLSDFNEEYYGGSFQHSGKALHKTKEEKRECYTRNNTRNRDMYTISRTKGWVVSLQDNVDAIEANQTVNPRDHEDVLVEALDMKDSIEKAALAKPKKKTKKKTSNKN